MSLRDTRDIGTAKIVMLGGGGGLPETPLSIAHGGTGNTDGYIRTGAQTGSTIGNRATAEGYQVVASGRYSHAGGLNNRAEYEAQMVCGKYNDNKSATLFEVGNGTVSTQTGVQRSNAFEVYSDGKVSFDNGATKYQLTSYNGDFGFYDASGTFHTFSGGSGGDGFSGLGIGKKKTVTNNIIDTDIDLHRAPIVGDRLLVYFDEKVTNPTGLTTYNNGTAVTSNLEPVTPIYINGGWNILEFKNDGFLYNNCWVRMQNVNTPTTLSGLSDTLINSPSDGQMLAYDNSSSKWKNKTIAANNGGTPVRELKTIQIGDNVFDTFGLKTFDVTSVTSGVNGAISVDVITASQLNGEIIAVYTGGNTGSTGNAWTLALSDAQTVEALTMSKADGTAFTEALTANSLMFVKVNTSNDTAVVLGIVGAGSNVSANGSGSPVSYLNKLKIGSAIYDTSAIRPFSVSQIANNTVKIFVANIDQLDGKVIALSTGALTGTTSSAWSLNLVDTSGGAVSLDVSMLNADGTAFSDDIGANELLFVAIDLTNYEGVILSVIGKSEDEIKTATGNPITLTDAIAGNAIEVSAEIVATQSGSGTPSPTNVRPISGFSSVVITDTDAQGQTATVTVALGRTVYGGTLDLTSGELTVTHVMVTLDDTDNWSVDSVRTHSFSVTKDLGLQTIWTAEQAQNAIANIAYASGYDAYYGRNSAFAYSGTSHIMYLSNGNISSVADLKAILANTPLQICGLLATPTTTTLTAAQLALVKGYNQLTCNSGDMEITYKASGLDALKERVEELEDRVDDVETELASKAENSVVGNVENGTTASQAYAVGEHFIRNDKFCTVIATIASGATLTLNTNYVEGTIAECIARQGTYSTTETEIGTWLNQKHYRVVLYFDSLGASSPYNVTKTLPSNINIDKLYGCATLKNTKNKIPLPYVPLSNPSTDGIVLNSYPSGNDILVGVQAGKDRSGWEAYVVVEYTKS